MIGFCLEIAWIAGLEKPRPGRVLAPCDTSPGILLRRPHLPQKDAFSGISDPQNSQLLTVCYPTFARCYRHFARVSVGSVLVVRTQSAQLTHYQH